MSHGVAQFIQHVRHALGLNQTEFGLLLGVKTAQVSRWERDQHSPQKRTWGRIVQIDALGDPDEVHHVDLTAFGSELQLLLIRKSVFAARDRLYGELNKARQFRERLQADRLAMS